MATFSEKFGFTANPFEKYVAENEPDIDSYAVTPPYFEETRKHTNSLTSFILFGFRGSGKSATRLTNEKDVWTREASGEKVPLIVNLTNFEPLIGRSTVNGIAANAIIKRVAFLSLEAILLWISNQDEKEETLDLLTEAERRRFVKLVKAIYLPVPEFARRLSLESTMQIMQQTWINRTAYWIERKWEPISAIASKITSKAGEKYLDLDGTAGELQELLKRDLSLAVGEVTLGEITVCAQSFGFSGVCVYVDKVDEHPKTQDSAEEAAKLVYPIVSQVQLLEISGFAWIFFLWDQLKETYTEEKLRIRLDKYAYSEISWDAEFLRSMVKKRLSHFSNGVITDGQDLCQDDVDFVRKLVQLIELVQRSPRELIRLLDVVIREYDARYFSKEDKRSLSEADFEIGVDSYIRNVIWTIYPKKILSQILVLKKTEFLNSDVQRTFRISAQSARNRIRNWTMSGAVRHTGTTASEGEGGGKPAHVYSVIDPRIVRMMERELYEHDNLVVEAEIMDE